MLAAPGAYAATPKDIAADLKDGRLDGTYTRAELEAFMSDAMVQGYGNQIEMAGAQRPAAGVAGVRTQRQQPSPTAAQGRPAGERAVRATAPARTLPFTGVDLALVAGGGMMLVLLGFGARRLSRQPS